MLRRPIPALPPLLEPPYAATGEFAERRRKLKQGRFQSVSAPFQSVYRRSDEAKSVLCPQVSGSLGATTVQKRRKRSKRWKRSHGAVSRATAEWCAGTTHCRQLARLALPRYPARRTAKDAPALVGGGGRSEK
jgi:hypothetical protein